MLDAAPAPFGAMSYAIVFAGQGMQHPDMLPWVGDPPLLQTMCRHLGVPDWRQALGDPAWAECNRHAQVLLTATALAAWQRLAPALPTPAAVAGYSVGEVAAFSAAGVYGPEDALALAAARAQAMDRCAQASPGGLLSVSGLAPERVRAACERFGLDIAIHNGADAFVLGGPCPALDDMHQHTSAQGGRATRLRVGLASHTPAMREAGEAFQAALQTVTCQRPHSAVFSNATGERVSTEAALRTALATQIHSTVRWGDCMEGIHARRVSCVLEIGPGHALARMWNDRHPDVPARSCDDFRSADAAVRWVLSRCAE